MLTLNKDNDGIKWIDGKGKRKQGECNQLNEL